MNEIGNDIADDIGAGNGAASRRTVIGGRHGSPTVTLALPFSRITNVDPELRGSVAELAARLLSQA